MPRLFWLLPFFCSVLFGDIVEDGLKNIPLHHRVCMRAFFEHAIFHDQAAHVLFFENKPACLIATLLRCKNKPYDQVIHLKGWRFFQKHQELFPHPNFIFSEDYVTFAHDFKVLHIYLINKRSLESCLTHHFELFKSILGEEFTLSNFLAQLEQGISLPQLLNHDEMLLGIILGFGKESSQAFKEGIETECVEVVSPKGCRFAPIIFAGDPQSPEVQHLCAAYALEFRDIWEHYKQSKNSLVIALRTLCKQ